MKLQAIGLGAGAHARVVIEMLKSRDDIEIVGLLDCDPSLDGTEIESIPVIGNDSKLQELHKHGITTAFSGLGSTRSTLRRAQLFETALSTGFTFLTVIHDSAIISQAALIGEGSVIMAGVIINTQASTGVNTIINSAAVVEHDCDIGNHVHVASGAIIAGGVSIEDNAFIGAGATIRQGVRIGTGATVGAGAVVINNVTKNTIVAGVPAREVHNDTGS